MGFSLSRLIFHEVPDTTRMSHTPDSSSRPCFEKVLRITQKVSHSLSILAINVDISRVRISADKDVSLLLFES